jgi:hypothetical protein
MGAVCLNTCRQVDDLLTRQRSLLSVLRTCTCARLHTSPVGFVVTRVRRLSPVACGDLMLFPTDRFKGLRHSWLLLFLLKLGLILQFFDQIKLLS